MKVGLVKFILPIIFWIGTCLAEEYDFKRFYKIYQEKRIDHYFSKRKMAESLVSNFKSFKDLRPYLNKKGKSIKTCFKKENLNIYRKCYGSDSGPLSNKLFKRFSLDLQKITKTSTGIIGGKTKKSIENTIVKCSLGVRGLVDIDDLSFYSQKMSLKDLKSLPNVLGKYNLKTIKACNYTIGEKKLRVLVIRTKNSKERTLSVSEIEASDKESDKRNRQKNYRVCNPQKINQQLLKKNVDPITLTASNFSDLNVTQWNELLKSFTGKDSTKVKLYLSDKISLNQDKSPPGLIEYYFNKCPKNKDDNKKIKKRSCQEKILKNFLEDNSANSILEIKNTEIISKLQSKENPFIFPQIFPIPRDLLSKSKKLKGVELVDTRKDRLGQVISASKVLRTHLLKVNGQDTFSRYGQDKSVNYIFPTMTRNIIKKSYEKKSRLKMLLKGNIKGVISPPRKLVNTFIADNMKYNNETLLDYAKGDDSENSSFDQRLSLPYSKEEPHDETQLKSSGKIKNIIESEEDDLEDYQRFVKDGQEQNIFNIRTKNDDGRFDIRSGTIDTQGKADTFINLISETCRKKELSEVCRITSLQYNNSCEGNEVSYIRNQHRYFSYISQKLNEKKINAEVVHLNIPLNCDNVIGKYAENMVKAKKQNLSGLSQLLLWELENKKVSNEDIEKMREILKNYHLHNSKATKDENELRNIVEEINEVKEKEADVVAKYFNNPKKRKKELKELRERKNELKSEKSDLEKEISRVDKDKRDKYRNELKNQIDIIMNKSNSKVSSTLANLINDQLIPRSTNEQSVTEKLVRMTALTEKYSDVFQQNCKSGLDRTGIGVALRDGMKVMTNKDERVRFADNFTENLEKANKQVRDSLKKNGTKDSYGGSLKNISSLQDIEDNYSQSKLAYKDYLEAIEENEDLKMVNRLQTEVARTILTEGREVTLRSTGVGGFKWSQKGPGNRKPIDQLVAHPAPLQLMPPFYKLPNGEVVQLIEFNSKGQRVGFTRYAEKLFLDQQDMRGS